MLQTKLEGNKPKLDKISESSAESYYCLILVLVIFLLTSDLSISS